MSPWIGRWNTSHPANGGRNNRSMQPFEDLSRAALLARYVFEGNEPAGLRFASPENDGIISPVRWQLWTMATNAKESTNWLNCWPQLHLDLPTRRNLAVIVLVNRLFFFTRKKLLFVKSSRARRSALTPAEPANRSIIDGRRVTNAAENDNNSMSQILFIFYWPTVQHFRYSVTTTSTFFKEIKPPKLESPVSAPRWVVT